MEKTAAPASIDAYIESFPEPIQRLLTQIRETIRQAVPEAVEKISYQMPTFYLHGNLVHFAAFKEHIGFYPTPSGITTFDAALKPYKSGKGSVLFPLDQPLPLELITQIAQFRAEENLRKQSAKRRK